MIRLPLYQRVALSRDIAQHGFRRGDVATLVDYVSHPAGGPEGCVLEVFNALGESLVVITVSVTDIKPLEADEILSVRHLAGAS